MKKIIEYAHELLKECIDKNDICVDMTLGNGNDTLYLAKKCKFVYAFDIQEVAINKSDELLKKENIDNYLLILDSHVNIDNYITKKVKAFIFNLGYLPTGNKQITTLGETTLIAINKALNLLDVKGRIIIVCYSGHENGKIETDMVYDFASKLNQKEYNVLCYRYINQINNPPYIIAIERK